MSGINLADKIVLITGAARRVGRALALSVAQAGATVIIHHSRSPTEAEEVRAEIDSLGSKAYILRADLSEPTQVASLIPQALVYGPLYALINSAAIFEPLTISSTDISAWERHLAINLTAPFLLSQAFFTNLAPGNEGRIINILDWRALRPSSDHLPYTISKAALAALTRSMAVALAPRITVNGLAFGAILPPNDGAELKGIIDNVPANRWANLDEVGQALIFLLTGPSYITGEILHVDGGRHLI